MNSAHCSYVVVEESTWATTPEPTIAPRNVSKYCYFASLFSVLCFYVGPTADAQLKLIYISLHHLNILRAGHAGKELMF